MGGHDDCAAAVAGLAVRLVGERAAPGLVRYESMLEGGEGLANPIDRDGPVFAILCTAPDGALATIYGARYVNYSGKKYPLVVLDFTCGYLNPDMFLEASTRLKEFNLEIPLSSSSQLLEVYGASAAPALYCPKDVAEQSRILSASWYDIHSLPDLNIEQIKPTVAARVNAGHVKLSTMAVERARQQEIQDAMGESAGELNQMGEPKPLAADSKADSDYYADMRRQPDHVIDAKVRSVIAGIQARADKLHSMQNGEAPRPLSGEGVYRLVNAFKKFSPAFARVDLNTIPNGPGFLAVEDSIYADAETALKDPRNFIGEGDDLYERKARDASGREISTFHSNIGPSVWMRQFAGGTPRRLIGIKMQK